MNARAARTALKALSLLFCLTGTADAQWSAGGLNIGTKDIGAGFNEITSTATATFDDGVTASSLTVSDVTNDYVLYSVNGAITGWIDKDTIARTDVAEVFTSTLEAQGVLAGDDNEHLYVGTGNDVDVYHTGTHTYLIGQANNTGGWVYLQGKSHGEGFYIQAENAAGTNRTIWTLDPDGPSYLYDDGEEVLRTSNTGNGGFSVGGNGGDIYDDGTYLVLTR